MLSRQRVVDQFDAPNNWASYWGHSPSSSNWDGAHAQWLTLVLAVDVDTAVKGLTQATLQTSVSCNATTMCGQCGGNIISRFVHGSSPHAFSHET